MEFIHGNGGTDREIDAAQFALDHYPENSPYWDSRAGQETLETADIFRLKPATTEQFRRKWNDEQGSNTMSERQQKVFDRTLT